MGLHSWYAYEVRPESVYAQSKGTRHPADYKPRPEFWCTYAIARERIKGTWELEMTPREEASLEEMKATCP